MNPGRYRKKRAEVPWLFSGSQPFFYSAMPEKIDPGKFYTALTGGIRDYRSKISDHPD